MTSRDGSAPLERAVLGVLGPAGTRVGVGFLIAPDLALTCAHVVSSAVGAEAGAGSQVSLDLPLISASHQADEDGTVSAVVEHWEPPAPDGGGDIAVLRLREALPQGRPATMVEAADLWGHPMRTFGFPVGREFGVWHAGRLLGRQAAGWIQAQLAEPSGYRIEQGFSGAPVWDDELGGVVGMVVAADSSATPAGYLIPTDTLLGGWPELRSLVRPPSPYRGLAPFRATDRAVFFGRDREVDELVELTGGPGPVTVVGPSGCGKSSLVFAGLLPVLQERDGRSPTIVTLRPSAGRTVYTALAAALLAVLEPELTEVERLSELATLADVLQTQGLADVVARVLERTGTAQLVVILDQAEELLAQHPDQVERFSELLLGPNTPAGLQVLLTLRADFLDTALSSPALSFALRRSVYTLGAMTAEQLRAVVAQPVAGVPGVEFQDGLVERILADVGTEPGALPLLGLALSLLWERQSGGRLTHEAYEGLGKVSGSLGRYAEEVWSRSGLADDEETARTLFLRLVRVSPGGEITRRVVTSDDLDAGRWELAQHLATTRLLVTGRDAEGRETVELAHEALVDGWARLRGWIDADREFLGWQEQFDRQLRQWETTARDQGALLRGVALAVAEEWLRSRPADISMAGHQYVTLSRVHQRRAVRRWRVVTAVLAILVLVAGGLAGVALDRGNRLDRQLNIAIAGSLGEEALARSTEDPAMATQLALAAWRADPDNPRARRALGSQYLAMQSVDRAFDELSDRPVNTFGLSADGTVMVLPHSQGFVVVTGLAGSEPHRRVIPDARRTRKASLSPDGRWLTAGDASGSVWIWDLSRRNDPQVLSEGDPGEGATPEVRFSPDSRRLVWLAPKGAGGRRELVVWDVATGARIDHQMRSITEPDVTDVWLTDNPNLAIFRYESADPYYRSLVVRDLSTGANVRTMPPDSMVAQHGRSVLYCTDSPPDSNSGRSQLNMLRSDTGEELRRFPSACSTKPNISADEDYVVDSASYPEADHEIVKVTDLSDGSTFEASTPARSRNIYAGIPEPDVTFDLTPSSEYLPIGVFSPSKGKATMLFARGSTVLRIGDMTRDLRGTLKHLDTRMSDDGRYLVIRDVEGVTVLDRATGRELGHLASAEVEKSVTLLGGDFVGTYFTIVIMSRESWVVTQYSLPGLERHARYALPSALPGTPSHGAVVGENDDKLVAVTSGMLSVWNTRTGTIRREPVRLGRGKETGWYYQNENLTIQTGHPHQIAILALDGSIKLWDIEQWRWVRTIPTKIHPDGRNQKIIFEDGGDRLVSLGRDGVIEVWDAETGRALRAPIAAPGASSLLGFDSAGHLVIESGSDVVEFWDLNTGRQSGLLRLANSIESGRTVDKGRLIVRGRFGLPYELPINAQDWFDHLCNTLDRDFAESERTIIPQGTDLTPPCSSKR